MAWGGVEKKGVGTKFNYYRNLQPNGTGGLVRNEIGYAPFCHVPSYSSGCMRSSLVSDNVNTPRQGDQNAVGNFCENILTSRCRGVVLSCVARAARERYEPGLRATAY
jgi:hypothetical protein